MRILRMTASGAFWPTYLQVKLHTRQSEIVSLRSFRCFESLEGLPQFSITRSKHGRAARSDELRTRYGRPAEAEAVLAASSPAERKERFGFFAETTFASFKLNARLCDSLKTAGFHNPSKVQALAFGHVLEGENMVLAAETGSGKTLAYLTPIVSQLLDGFKQGKQSEDQGGLILCPNAALCDQVVSFADRLRDLDGHPLISAIRLAANSPPPRELPDLVVATPAGLINAALEYAPAYGRHWSSEGIVNRMRWVVFDEADLLLGGGFLRDVRRILHSMREGDRRKIAQDICAQHGLGLEEFYALPKHLRQRAMQDGPEALVKAKVSPKPAHGEPPPQPCLWTRQYCFVAATLPEDGAKSIAALIRQVCPEAAWVSGAQLHRSVVSVQHEWAEVDEHSWAAALQAVVAAHIKSQPSQNKTLVFAGSVANADAAAEVLSQAGLDTLKYHRGILQHVREDVLWQAQHRQSGVVVVCTDAASRGLDIPNVTHVVQSEFASSAVDFLHRVGRTGRAGQPGKVTSLYTPETKVLAEAIREAISAGQPVEGAFSRNRSFRKKVRKYGRYVPRGQQG